MGGGLFFVYLCKYVRVIDDIKNKIINVRRGEKWMVMKKFYFWIKLFVIGFDLIEIGINIVL